MLDVTDEMVADLWLEEPTPKAILVSLDGAGIVEGPLLFCNHPGKLAGERVKQGLVSNGDTYLYAPFSFAWSGASKTEPTRDATLTISGFDGILDAAIDEATGRPKCTVKVVRVSNPDTVELAITDARITSAELDGPKAAATLTPRDFGTEPACSARATPARTPCLF